jgi:hypothetical protein
MGVSERTKEDVMKVTLYGAACTHAVVWVGCLKNELVCSLTGETQPDCLQCQEYVRHNNDEA